ncbi:MAG: FKBP-type peptidyl-prolyl cis-trans isomerase [Bacteroidetes bacterium]|nr:FKBP-type peptidyl-prolyl cis-trans isomerase [Bacteroidota bacterium]
MTKFFITLATLGLFFVSCNKMQKTTGGLEYKIFTSNGGEKITAGDLVFFKVIGKAGDSALFDTYKNTHTPYMNLVVNDKFSPGNFEEGLTLLGKGDSALFRIVADSFYKVYIGTPTPAFIKKGDRLQFFIKIDSFITRKTMAERKVIQELETAEKQKNEGNIIEEYIKNSGVKYIKTESGLYYTITTATKGAKASAGDKVATNYTGKLFDGKVFDSNDKTGKPFEFVLGSRQVIAGWDELFGILHQGEKATAVIPSSLAYADQGAGGEIAPFTPLIFDVELLTVTKAKK